MVFGYMGDYKPNCLCVCNAVFFASWLAIEHYSLFYGKQEILAWPTGVLVLVGCSGGFFLVGLLSMDTVCAVFVLGFL